MPRAGPLRRSGLITSWLGLARGVDGQTRVTITWEPIRRPFAARSRTEPAMVVVNASTESGTPLFEGTIAAVGGVAPQAAPSAIFDAPPGRIELELAILSAEGTRLDSELRVLEVAAAPGGSGPVILPPHVVRARTARELTAASLDADAAPAAGRDFYRIERLLIRAPAYDAAGNTLPVRATLLNALGRPMREVASISTPSPTGLPQFDLPLGPLWPGTYSVELVAAAEGEEAKAVMRFRVVR
jgi:hypothetical protein